MRMQKLLFRKLISSLHSLFNCGLQTVKNVYLIEKRQFVFTETIVEFFNESLQWTTVDIWNSDRNKCRRTIIIAVNTYCVYIEGKSERILSVTAMKRKKNSFTS